MIASGLHDRRSGKTLTCSLCDELCHMEFILELNNLFRLGIGLRICRGLLIWSRSLGGLVPKHSHGSFKR